MEILTATNRKTWPRETVKLKAAETPDTLLDHHPTFWMGFVTDGHLDTNALKEAGYTDGQMDYIRSEMIRRGWLPS